MTEFMYEIGRYRVGPDRMFRGVPCSISLVEVVQVVSDPNPFPRLRLWSRRRAA